MRDLALPTSKPTRREGGIPRGGMARRRAAFEHNYVRERGPCIGDELLKQLIESAAEIAGNLVGAGFKPAPTASALWPRMLKAPARRVQLGVSFDDLTK